MAKKQKTELPEIELYELKEKIEDAATRLLEDTVPNRKVIKNVVKTFFGIVENNYKVNSTITWQDKRDVMDSVFKRIN